MTLDDKVGSIVRSHEAAPGSGSAQPTGSRRRWVKPLAAAATILLIGGGTFALSRTLGGSSGPQSASNPVKPAPPGAGAPACPPRYKGLDGELTPNWVPDTPAGIDTGGRLVPDRTPLAAVVCSYSGPVTVRVGTSAHQTATHRLLDGGLGSIRASLAGLAPIADQAVCGGVGLRTDGDAALLGLRYPGGGVVWVSVTGHDCSRSGNGVVTTSSVYDEVSAAARSGSWHGSAPPAGGGRFGQQTEMVPEGVMSMTVQRHVTIDPSRGTKTTTYRLTRRQMVALAAGLDALPIGASSPRCRGSLAETTYTVTARYRSGGAVEVSILPGCHPDVANGSLASDSAQPVLAMLQADTR